MTTAKSLPEWTRQTPHHPNAYSSPDTKTIASAVAHRASRGWDQLGILFVDTPDRVYWMDRKGSETAKQIFGADIDMWAGVVIPSDFRWSILHPSAKAK